MPNTPERPTPEQERAIQWKASEMLDREGAGRPGHIQKQRLAEKVAQILAGGPETWKQVAEEYKAEHNQTVRR